MIDRIILYVTDDGTHIVLEGDWYSDSMEELRVITPEEPEE